MRMIVDNHSIAILVKEDVVVFEVKETDYEGTRFGKFPGIVRPRFVWSVHQIRRGE